MNNKGRKNKSHLTKYIYNFFIIWLNTYFETTLFSLTTETVILFYSTPVIGEHPVWPQSQKESRKCDAGRRSFDEPTSDISGINCLWSLMLEVRGKFTHQIEVSSRSDGLKWQSQMREQLNKLSGEIFPAKNPCDFCKIFRVYCLRLKKVRYPGLIVRDDKSAYC